VPAGRIAGSPRNFNVQAVAHSETIATKAALSVIIESHLRRRAGGFGNLDLGDSCSFLPLLAKS